jgi:hypothetical protein
MFHQFRHPKTGDILPAFTHKYRLTTVPQSNASGKWFGLKFSDIGLVTVPEYRMASALFEAVKSGAKKAEAPLAGEAGESDGNKEDIPF